MKFKNRCTLCGREFPSKWELDNHMKEFHDLSTQEQLPGSLESQVQVQSNSDVQEMQKLDIDINHHIFVSGQSGSGKSVLGKYIFANLSRDTKAIFYDYKLDPSHDNFCSKFPVFTELSEIKRHYENNGKSGWFSKKPKDLRVIYRPPRVKTDTIKTHSMENKNWVRMDDLCDYAYSEGNVILLLDEVNPFTTPMTLVPSLFDCMTMGRSRGITIITTSQRPNTIHNTLISEAQTRFMFRQEIESDRAKIKGICGAEVADQLHQLPNEIFIISRIGGNYQKGHITIPKKYQYIL